ncbi:MAG: alpha/beta fold hydrolase [Solirubrobacteraceae bacterium]
MNLVFDRRGSGEPLVLLHGIGSRWQAFAPVLDSLAEQFEVFAVDMPGFGASPAPPGGVPGIAALTDGVQAWMEAKGIGGAHVAGNSMGGGVALELADRGEVASATGLAPIGFWSTPERRWAQASLTNTRTLSRLLRPLAPAINGSPVGRTLTLAQYVAKPWLLDPAEVVLDIDALLGASAFDDAHTAFSGYLAPTTAADHVPVTIVWGGKDRLLLPRQLERARRRLPRARHVLLPNAGHVMMSDEPEAVAAIIASGTRAPTSA